MQMGVEFVFVLLLGLAVGSFLNVLIHRIPKGESIITPPSSCPTCQRRIRWHENIPLLSFLYLKGRCAGCSAAISLRYPFIEAATGLLFVLVFIKTGAVMEFFLFSGVFALLLAMSAIDAVYKAAPDSLNLAALTLSVLHAPYLVHMQAALLLAGGAVLLRYYMGYILKKEALGEADVMIAATLGGLLGIKGAFIAIFLASLIALPIALVRRSKDAQIPFIPFLFLGALAAFLLEEPIALFLRGLHG